MTLLDRHPDGVLEMLLFNRLGGGKFSENATPLSKMNESSKSLREVTFFDRHPDRGPRNVNFQSARRRQIFRKRNVCLKGDTLQRYTATTGFAGISTDAALPLSKAASVLSRVLVKNGRSWVASRL